MFIITTKPILETERACVVLSVDLINKQSDEVKAVFKEHPSVKKRVTDSIKPYKFIDKDPSRMRELLREYTTRFFVLGRLQFTKVFSTPKHKYWIVGMVPIENPKTHKVTYGAIRKALNNIVKRYKNNVITSLSIGVLGLGMEDIRPEKVIEITIDILDALDIVVELHTPETLVIFTERYLRKVSDKKL